MSAFGFGGINAHLLLEEWDSNSEEIWRNTEGNEPKCPQRNSKIEKISVEHPASSIEHRASSIEYSASSIEYPISSIKHRVSSIERTVYLPPKASSAISNRDDIGCSRCGINHQLYRGSVHASDVEFRRRSRRFQGCGGRGRRGRVVQQVRAMCVVR